MITSPQPSRRRYVWAGSVQPPGPPAPSYPAPGHPASGSKNLLLLLVGALVLIAVSGAVGYLIGSAGIQQATLRVNVENRLPSSQTVSISLNGKLQAIVPIPAGQTASVDIQVHYAVANGALFDVEATSALGARDSSTVLVNTPGVYVVSLRLG